MTSDVGRNKRVSSGKATANSSHLTSGSPPSFEATRWRWSGGFAGNFAVPAYGNGPTICALLEASRAGAIAMSDYRRWFVAGGIFSIHGGELRTPPDTDDRSRPTIPSFGSSNGSSGTPVRSRRDRLASRPLAPGHATASRRFQLLHSHETNQGRIHDEVVKRPGCLKPR